MLYRRGGKRLIDVVGAASALLLFSPIVAVVAVVIRVRLGSPVLFRQPRAGRDGDPFVLMKFRTMTDARDASGELLSDEERTPSLGRLLRATSLDELPTLVNVLRGEMSLVGPRPLPERYTARYDSTQRRRLEVRPGITGRAQVNGRNRIGWAERFAHDVDYVDSHSLLGDMRIVIETVGSVLARRDITPDSGMAMPEFHPDRAAPPHPDAPA